MTYRTLSSSTNITTTRAWGLLYRRSMIRSKSSGFECLDTFSDIATQIPKILAVCMKDAIPYINEIIKIQRIYSKRFSCHS